MGTIIIQFLSISLIAMVLVNYFIPVIVRVSKAKLLYDEPNHRRINKTSIPNLGGVALFIGITIPTLWGTQYYEFPDFDFILIAMILLFFVGMKDDIVTISAEKKLMAQIICALILIIPGEIRVTNLHGILGINEINYSVSVFISVFAMTFITNAINLIDGIDGLAAAIGILTTIIFGINFIFIGNYAYATLCMAIIGSLSTFFIYNVFGRTNKIFMGDTGSLLIGLLLSVFFIKYNELSINGNIQSSNFSPVFSLAIMSIPIFDMIRVFFKRIFLKKSPFTPDNNHIHHCLLKLGFSHLKSTMIIIVTNLVFIGVVYLLRIMDNNFLLVLLGSTVFFSLLLPEWYCKYKNRKTAAKLYN
jgi:UDP-GlcNAc:undecaprenyl-phosphate GlcNAc-1-phosphate transferase